MTLPRASTIHPTANSMKAMSFMPSGVAGSGSADFEITVVSTTREAQSAYRFQGVGTSPHVLSICAFQAADFLRPHRQGVAKFCLPQQQIQNFGSFKPRPNSSCTTEIAQNLQTRLPLSSVTTKKHSSKRINVNMVNALVLARLGMDFQISFSYAPPRFFGGEGGDLAVGGPRERFEATKYT